MEAGFSATARQLWRSAPYWRLSVIGGAVFTVLSVLHLWSSPGSSGPSVARYVAPPVPADPASEARLADYEKLHGDASNIAGAGDRCERLADALNALTSDDVKRGRNIIASSRPRIAALADGERCHDDIARSDRHFSAVADAVAAAQKSATPQSLVAAADSLKRLDAFDRSRPRFQSDGSIAQAHGFQNDLEASDARIQTMSQGSTAFQQDPSAENALRAADTVFRITPFDQARLSDSQQSLLGIAKDAVRLVRESRNRLAQLGRLLAATQAYPTPTAQQQLVDAVSAISPFDQAIASPEQKKVLDQARAAAIAAAWSIAEQRVANLDRDKSPSNYEAVSAIYALLKNIPVGNLTAEQHGILAKTQSASEALAESDARLKALVDAANQWKDHGVEGGNAAVLVPLHNITVLDQSRFQIPEKEAWARLHEAEAVIRGAEVGLNSRDKSSVGLFVFSSGSNPSDALAVEILRNELSRRGFKVATDKRQGALITDIRVKGSPEAPHLDWSTPVVQNVFTIQLEASFNWASDDSQLAACSPVSSVRGPRPNDLIRLAVQKAAGDIVDCLEKVAGMTQSVP